MFEVKINRQDQITLQLVNAAVKEFNTLEEANEWVVGYCASGVFGKPERWVLHKDEESALPYDDSDVLEERVIQAEFGNSKKEVKLKAEYFVEIKDITEEVAQKTAQLQALYAAQLAAAARLESFDAEIDSASNLEELKAKIKTFVMDVAVLLVR